MRFQLLDAVILRESERIVALKNVSLAEEYLAEHFPGFPVLPGVFMIEVMVQAARALLGEEGARLVLGGVRALRYGSFVRPGEALRVEVTLEKRLADGAIQFKGSGVVVRPTLASVPAAVASAPEAAGGPPAQPAETAVAGRFTMRPVRRPARAR